MMWKFSNLYNTSTAPPFTAVAFTSSHQTAPIWPLQLKVLQQVSTNRFKSLSKFKQQIHYFMHKVSVHIAYLPPPPRPSQNTNVKRSDILWNLHSYYLRIYPLVLASSHLRPKSVSITPNLNNAMSNAITKSRQDFPNVRILSRNP